MTLPASFLKDGFVAPSQLRKAKYRRLMIGCDGPPDTGKTEFALSCPGPGIGICLDRGFDAVLDNPDPPAARHEFAFQVINAPLSGGATQKEYEEYWVRFRSQVYAAANNPDCRTVLIDGDSDSWEIQRLAAFGKLTKIPSILYTDVNAARRLFYARLHDSGKIIVATNKIKKNYTDKLNPDGSKMVSDSGKPIREWDGTYTRMGFDDQEYLWHIQLSHLFDPISRTWGLRITKAKANAEAVGGELWGNDCNFESLVQVVYPHIDPKEWGL